MCGIAGLVLGAPDPEARSRVDAMTELLAHRGPDDSGVYESPDGLTCLGHRRLSIIDLSAEAREPMQNEAGTLWLVYNGEIYNYRELDAELKAKGYVYRSRSDAETIVHAYEEWGTDCLTRFNGMFAFALWDEARRQLFCARDRFGEKPFYYRFEAGSFAFASEIKALLDLASRPRVNPAGLARYLAHGLADEAAATCFDAIFSLPAAHSLTLRDGRLELRRYWSLPGEAEDEGRGDADWESAFLELVTDSVRLRLRSDVPLGVCLSGGLDSSSIVALASRLEGREVAAFSVLYDEAGLAERSFVEAVTRAFPLRAAAVSPDGRDLFGTLASIVWHNDEPSTSVGQYSQWHVMRLARDHGVKVLLNGQGGDEILAGYERYVTTHTRERMLRGDLVGAARSLAGEARMRGGGLRGGLKRVVYPITPRPLREGYRRMLGGRTIAADFLTPELLAAAGEVSEDFRSLRDHLATDLTALSVPALVHAEDRCSMAFSREIRLPFLDHRLVELMFRMPSRMKIRGGVTKHVLRQVMAREGLPAPVASRQDKKGYPTPMGRWLRTSALDETRALLGSDSFRNRGLLDVPRALATLEEHASGAADHTALLWRWINVELWFRRFVDAKVR
jgi:asparagine synthase (glutamine-hydrolysing)